MLLTNWLVVLRDRLWKSQHQSTRCRGKRRSHSAIPAMLEVLEPRRVMSAVAAVDDSYTVDQQQMMMVAAPVVMDVLANDTSSGGQMSIVSPNSMIPLW